MQQPQTEGFPARKGTADSAEQDLFNKIVPNGGDLFMPGCKADYDNILKGLADGSLTRQQLQINATRIYRMANELNK